MSGGRGTVGAAGFATSDSVLGPGSGSNGGAVDGRGGLSGIRGTLRSAAAPGWAGPRSAAAQSKPKHR